MPVRSLKVIASRRVHPKARVDTCELPNGLLIEPIILEFSDWACVFALTKDQDVLLIRLYRHGAGQVIWEIPGGVIDPGETPREAAGRELLEETGYGNGSLIELAALSPNPDNHTNRMHMFLALDVEKLGPQSEEDLDRIEVHPTPLARVIEMAQNGELIQSMHVSALFLALAHLKRIS
jgi:8-oxo-dGTP pyrophosphatase MutT (NUDIX family)